MLTNRSLDIILRTTYHVTFMDGNRFVVFDIVEVR